jgi:hypothetical protein
VTKRPRAATEFVIHLRRPGLRNARLGREWKPIQFPAVHIVLKGRTMSIGLILIIILIIFLAGGFSGRFGGYGYGYGHGGVGIIGIVLIVLVALLLTGRI